jgi:hypothetical protein
MFSQLRRLAATAEVTIDDLEMGLRMTYDLTGKFPIKEVFRRGAGDQLQLQDQKSVTARERD